MAFRQVVWSTIIALISVIQSVTGQTCMVEGGVISTGNATIICAGDPLRDTIDVTLVDNFGEFSAWLITDENQVIISSPPGPPFDFNDAGPGVSLIYHISYEGEIDIIEETNISELQGCIDFSNPISIVATGVEGGVIFDNNNQTGRTICITDDNPDAISLTLQDNFGTTSEWIITDENGNILALPSGPPFDFNGVNVGICYIYHVSHDEASGIIEGNNISDLSGCYSLSNGYKVTRVDGDVDGGFIVSDGPTSFCSGDGRSDFVQIEISEASNENSRIVLTDDNGVILDIMTSTLIDFEGVPGTRCHIRHLSYASGVKGLDIGKNISELEGCFDFSNAITITKENISGGAITDTNGNTEIGYCTDDNNAELLTMGVANNIGQNRLWLVTDSNGKIVDTTSSNLFIFEGFPEGICFIYNVSFNDPINNLDTGVNIVDLQGCHSLSNQFTVNRFNGATNGGTISTSDETFLCSGDGIEDIINVTLVGSGTNQSAWLVTDQDGSILEIGDSPVFDFSNAQGGICLIYHLDYIEGILNLEAGSTLSDLQGCFSLSNSITVNRNGVLGGELSFFSGDTIASVCVGNQASDILQFSLTEPFGDNSSWLVTTMDDTIILINGDDNIDFNDFQEGQCKVYHLSYEDNTTGITLGNHLGEIMGCYDLSNSVTIIKVSGVTQPGIISTLENTDVCLGDGDSDNILFQEVPGIGTNSKWLVLNTGGKILRIHPTRNINLEGISSGTCSIRNLRYEDGIIGLEEGKNISNIQGCFSISNNIFVNKTRVTGGFLDLSDGSGITTVYCKDKSNPITVNLTGNEGPESTFLVTDNAGNIEAITDNNSFDFSQFANSSYLIWHLSYKSDISGLNVGGNTNSFFGCFDLSNRITVKVEEVKGGDIITTDGLTEVSICGGEGVEDLIGVQLINVQAQNTRWVITDNNGFILDIPSGPVFSFEDAPTGICTLRNISYTSGLENLEVGKNVSDLIGCYDFSNPITITRSLAIGGELTANGSSNFISICAGNNIADVVTFEVADFSAGQRRIVLTDLVGDILEILTSMERDFNSFPEGACIARNISYYNISGLAVGNNIEDLSGCYSLSNEVSIFKDRPDGGNITDGNDQQEVNICIGDDVTEFVNIKLWANNGENSGWLITEGNGNILSTNSQPPFNLENAGPGICLIYHIAYDGNLSGKKNGNNLNDITGCYSLSNALVVNRKEIAPGTITTADGSIEKNICVDDNLSYDIEILSEGEKGESTTFVITDTLNNILAMQNSPSINLDNAGEGVCFIYQVNYNNTILNLDVGNNIDTLEGCFKISNNVKINRLAGSACTVSTLEIGGQEYNIDLYPNPAGDYINIVSDIPASSNVSYKIYNLTGKLVKSINPSELSKPIIVEELDSGIYFLSVSSGRKSILLKMIKI